MTKVFIPSTVKVIGEKAFYSCNKLKVVNIPDSVKEIGKNAFRSIYNNITFQIENIDKWCNIDIGNELTEKDFYLEEDVELNADFLNKFKNCKFHCKKNSKYFKWESQETEYKVLFVYVCMDIYE